MSKSEIMKNQIPKEIAGIVDASKRKKRYGSLVPDDEEYKHLSDPKNINNKKTINYTEGIVKDKYIR